MSCGALSIAVTTQELHNSGTTQVRNTTGMHRHHAIDVSREAALIMTTRLKSLSSFLEPTLWTHSRRRLCSTHDCMGMPREMECLCELPAAVWSTYTHLMPSFDELLIHALDLDVYLETKTLLLLWLPDMHLGVDHRILCHISLAKLARHELHGTQEAGF